MSVRDDYPAVAILHDAWTSRDRTGETPPQAVRMFDEIQRLRSYCDAWMNGVADVVEPLGFDREAACGPADLLPGLGMLLDDVRLVLLTVGETWNEIEDDAIARLTRLVESKSNLSDQEGSDA